MSDVDDLAPIPAPGPLGAPGAVFWNRVTETFEPEPHEAQVLYSACRILDRISELESDLVDRPTTVRGSHGGEVINPIIPEILKHRNAFAQHVRALSLPAFDDDSGEAAEVVAFPERKMTRSEAGKAGAAARWKHKGYR